MKRNIVISTKVTPEEKAEFIMIAQRYGISLSEWVYSTLSMNKNGYEKAGRKRMEFGKIRTEKRPKIDRPESSNSRRPKYDF